MSFTEHPRSLARLAGAFYLLIIAFALFGYLYVRGQLIIPGDMAQTGTNIAAREQRSHVVEHVDGLDSCCNDDEEQRKQGEAPVHDLE